MNEYYFLFALAFLWTFVATIQDLKKREVANWLNFSFIAFTLAYRAFYSILNSDYRFFVFGILGFVMMFILAHALYYSKIFAGGDAKLLMGFGVILPYTNYLSVLYLSVAFVILLFLVGSVYSLIYSLFIGLKNKEILKKELRKRSKMEKLSVVVWLILSIVFVFWSFDNVFALAFALLFFTYPLYIYTKAVEKCMIKLVSPDKLTEGDWLEKEVKLGKTKIKKSVHGLSLKEIAFLRKHKKKVYVKEGIPFVPAFLVALIVLVIMFFKFPEFSLLNLIP